MSRSYGILFIVIMIWFCPTPAQARGDSDSPEELAELSFPQLLHRLIDINERSSGVYILDKGEEALLARAWMVSSAVESFDVVTFIWSLDTIGMIATASLLRAAERGVRVRVAVDDIHLSEEHFDILLALSAHPLIEIRVFNPVVRVGVSRPQQIINLFTDFRRFNHRMHNKTIIADRVIGICGGRNVANEYFDYDQEYNFRDRDILVIGPVVEEMQSNFERYWDSKLMHPIQDLLPERSESLSPDEVSKIYRELEECVQHLIDNLPLVRRALKDPESKIQTLIEELYWTSDIWFVSDDPERNVNKPGVKGGGKMDDALRKAIDSAVERITIQSPYFILPKDAFGLLKKIEEGVEVLVSTNSLSSTDNIATFSGYNKLRGRLIAAGMEIREFRPNPAIEDELLAVYHNPEKSPPIFVLHAKTLVIDGELLYVGTFNMSPRSANLSTEEGIFVRSRELARRVEEQILIEMQPENSWNPAEFDPNPHAGLGRRLGLWFLQVWPIRPLL